MAHQALFPPPSPSKIRDKHHKCLWRQIFKSVPPWRLSWIRACVFSSEVLLLKSLATGLTWRQNILHLKRVAPLIWLTQMRFVLFSCLFTRSSCYGCEMCELHHDFSDFFVVRVEKVKVQDLQSQRDMMTSPNMTSPSKLTSTNGDWESRVLLGPPRNTLFSWMLIQNVHNENSKLAVLETILFSQLWILEERQTLLVFKCLQMFIDVSLGCSRCLTNEASSSLTSLPSEG